MPFTDLDQDVRAKLFQLMTGLLPLRDFQIWFAPVAWRLGRPENEGGRHPLARRVELRVAEYVNGDWSETELLQELDRLVRPAGHAPVTLAVGFGDRSQRLGPEAQPWYGRQETSTKD